jgi:RNA-directed DNA polymerase
MANCPLSNEVMAAVTNGRRSGSRSSAAPWRRLELRKRMHDPIVETGTWVWQMLNGRLNYFAVSGNDKSLWWLFNEVRWRWLKSLKRRSQKAYMSWERFIHLTQRFFPPIRVRHPLPCHRFDAKIRGRSPVR